MLLLIVGISLSGVKKSLTNAVLEAEGKEPLPDMTTGMTTASIRRSTSPSSLP